jgi:hypothetical protein
MGRVKSLKLRQALTGEIYESTAPLAQAAPNMETFAYISLTLQPLFSLSLHAILACAPHLLLHTVWRAASVYARWWTAHR